MQFTRVELERILHGCPYLRPRVFFETGTQRGSTTMMALRSARFTRLITCELSPGFYAHARTRFADYTNVTVLHMDSREALREYAPPEPCLFYLDAHFTKDGGSVNDWPLYDELAVLRDRPHPDVIVIDDVRGFGNRDHGHDMTTITIPGIRNALGPAREAAHRTVGDQFVVYRTLAPGDGAVS